LRRPLFPVQYVRQRDRRSDLLGGEHPLPCWLGRRGTDIVAELRGPIVREVVERPIWDVASCDDRRRERPYGDFRVRVPALFQDLARPGDQHMLIEADVVLVGTNIVETFRMPRHRTQRCEGALELLRIIRRVDAKLRPCLQDDRKQVAQLGFRWPRERRRTKPPFANSASS
jgi:hypothetical protein